MARHERARPYQYGFDFGQQPLEPAGLVYDGSHRFVRALKEDIIVRTPAEGAAHCLNRIFTPFEAFEQEELWSLLLNTKQRITHEVMIYRGTINTIQIRLADIFKPAIRFNAAAFILAHNHPSSDPSPSPEDRHFTREAKEMGQHLGIDVLDHLVIGKNRWVSLTEHGGDGDDEASPSPP